MSRHQLTLTYTEFAEKMVYGTTLTVNDPLKAKSMIKMCIKYQNMGTKSLAKRVGLPEKCVRTFKQCYHSGLLVDRKGK